jgi:heat shock protein HslJ
MNRLTLLLSALALTACASTTEEGPTWTDVVGREWTATGDLAPATITFGANGRATGKVLNSYFAGYTRKGGALEFGAIGSTQMAGPEEDMARERIFHEALSATFRWRVVDGSLQLLGQERDVLVSFESDL